LARKALRVSYELYYWPSIQGRGEFIRLALEEAGAPYVDVAREKGPGRGVPALMAVIQKAERPPFAPPFLRDGTLLLGQTAAILLHLGDKLGLAPKTAADRLWTHQIQLTLSDLVVEAHDVHHPISAGLYYEDQKPEAKRRAEDFRESRIPKYFRWLESILERNPKSDSHLVGARVSYADLSAFQVVEGLAYAFPRATAHLLKSCPRLQALRGSVAKRPRVAAYLASERRIPFNTEGIFRAYPELDG
jgi:glutathione S-transferase